MENYAKSCSEKRRHIMSRMAWRHSS
jgi:hypothetical protein